MFLFYLQRQWVLIVELLIHQHRRIARGGLKSEFVKSFEKRRDGTGAHRLIHIQDQAVALLGIINVEGWVAFSIIPLSEKITEVLSGYRLGYVLKIGGTGKAVLVLILELLQDLEELIVVLDFKPQIVNDGGALVIR